LTELQDKGVIISSELLTKSRQALDKGSYDEALQLTKELENLITTTETRYRNAQEELKSAETAMEKAQEFGCTVLGIEGKLQDAHQLLAKGAYEESIKASKRVEESVNEIIGEAKPVIVLEFTETAFKPNVWKPLNLILRNTGNEHAKGVKIDFSQEVEVKKIPEVTIDSGKEKELKIGFKPIQLGNVPLETILQYKGFDDKEYKVEETYWITVGEIEEGKKEKKAVIEVKRGYEVLQNNDLKFGIRVTNNTDYAIMDVETILDYPRTLFQLKDNVVQTLANIPPKLERTAKYILTPLGCIHHEKIDATIRYKDHTGKKQTLEMRSKEVHCVCPFLKAKPLREGEFAQLANTYEGIKEELSFSGIDVEKLSAFVKESCSKSLYLVSEHHIDTADIISLSGESIGEKADYLLTAVILPYEGLTHIALRAFSDKTFGLQGFLNETKNSIDYLVKTIPSAKEIGIIRNEHVINIIDSVVQRSIVGGRVDATEPSSPSVTIKDSVVQRTNIDSE
jgi:hypothetical protein